MAITRVGTTITTTVPAGSTGITPTSPAGVIAGDVIIVAASVSRVSTTFSTSSYPGWVVADDLTETAMVTRVMWRVADGTAVDDPPLMSFTSSPGSAVATVAAYRGVDTASGPLLAHAGQVAASSQTSHPAPTLTNTDAGAWGVYAGHARQVATPLTWTAGAGLLELEDADNGASNLTNVGAIWADSNGTVATGAVTYSATTSATTAQSSAWAALLRAPSTTPGSATVLGATATVTVDAASGTLAGSALVVGVTATVTATAPAGSAVFSGAATIVGVTATVTASGIAGAIAAGAVAVAARTADVYRQALRSGMGLVYTVDAFYNDVPVDGATDLRPVGGSITDTIKPGVRRTLSLELADPDLFDKLAPIGTELRVSANVTYADRSTEQIPMGVFDVDSQRLSVGDGSLSLTAPDKFARIKRARFIAPQASTRGISVRDQIIRLIRGALGLVEVNDQASSSAIMRPLVWEKDRDQAIIDLAASIGAWVFFDRNGIATIDDVPTVSQTADWVVDASAQGVLISLDRERSRQNAYNVVVVESSAASGALFPTQVVWDRDPQSPTYAGNNPRTDPGSAGPFGVVPYFHDSPIARTTAQAIKIGQTILARTVGLASQVSLSQTPNPALDAFDVIDVLPPGWVTQAREISTSGGGFGLDPFGTGPFGLSTGGTAYETYRVSTQVIERHIADTVTHPLSATEPLRIDGRSTRTDEYTG